ncbi:MAG: asparagine synthase (glutamine-hydrolyzing) [Bacteroidota bacterium]
MCGIFGHIDNKGPDTALCHASLNTLTHRGPDQMGEYFDEHIFLGHRRLSILDLSENGRQPMDSGQTVISINGEIYNYQALKKELQTKYTFKSHSDSEVVLFGYEEWGLETLLNKIDGMYAIVIYDKLKQVVHLAKDRYGIKPLYYTNRNNTFSWASELKAIVMHAGEEHLDIDYTAVYDYLTYLYIPTPKTLYKDIFKLPPAHVLSYDIASGIHKIKKYWDLPVSENKITEQEAAEKVTALISNSVKEQLISDVPVGFFLSGGIDSSIVVSAASEFKKDAHTYSIGFEEPSQNETQYAKIVADLFKTHHHIKLLKRSDASKMIQRMKIWYDEPYADTSALPSYQVSALAKEKSTVVLTGDGGDELFGGYDWYTRFNKYKNQRLPLLSFLKGPLTTIRNRYSDSFAGRVADQLENRVCNDLELYAKLLGGLLKHEKTKYRKQWGIPDDYNDYWYFEKFYKPDLGPMKKLQYLDFHTYLHDDIFTKVDRVSMAASLECRVPFMKKELVEFAFSLPEDILYAGGNLKGLLKIAYKNILPHEILSRKKRGFNIPLKQWDKTFLNDSNSPQEFILQQFDLTGRKKKTAPEPIGEMVHS